MSASELGLLREIMLWLHREQEKLLRETHSRLSGETRDLYAVLELGWKPIESDRALEHVFKEQAGKLVGEDRKARYIYLEPTPRDETLPILSFAYDWTHSFPTVSLRVGLFCFDSAKEPAAIGYRFECPHASGNHHFYHAQPIKHLDDGKEVRMPQCPDWLPMRQPSFALDASDPITLVLCFLISLYGIDFIEQRLLLAPFRNNLPRYLDRMALRNADWQPMYWCVEFEGETVYYMTRRMEQAKFIALMKTGRRAKKVSSIGRRDYLAQDEEHRKEL